MAIMEWRDNKPRKVETLKSVWRPYVPRGTEKIGQGEGHEVMSNNNNNNNNNNSLLTAFS